MTSYPLALRSARQAKLQREASYYPMKFEADGSNLENLVIIHIGKDEPRAAFFMGQGLSNFYVCNVTILGKPPSLFGWLRLWWQHRRTFDEIIFGENS